MTTNATTTTNDASSLSVIQTDLGSSIYVEAGAGTGKTHSLVERITALLAQGTDIEQIIAITFTRAAAAELRSRIREKLESLRASKPDDENVNAALRGIDTAAFQTIDSLVYSILREYPLDAGMPPTVEVQDNISRLQTFQDRWRQWSIERLDDDEQFAESLTTALRLNLRTPFAKMSDVARSMNDNHGDLHRLVLAPPQQSCLSTVENLATSIEAIKSTMQWCSDTEDRLFGRFEEATDWYHKSIEGQEVATEHEAQELLMTWPKIKPGSSGTIGNWGGREGKAAAIEALNDFCDPINEAIDAAREAVTIDLARYARRFVDTVTLERRRSGTVSYYDAITWLNDLLETRDDIRRSLQRRYRHVLVDEFQDTDPNQVRLVRLLTIPPGEDSVAPGSLFIVGDPKQSIYRFRGAQVTVSQAVKEDIASSGGKYLTLKENRRSTRAVIDWVNHIFGKWMPSETDQADYIPLDRAKETAAPDDFGAVHHFGEPIKDANIGEVRAMDAEQVAIIARAVAAGELTVRDRQDQKCRPSHAGDLTILTSARTSWETYTRKLDDLNLPYSAEIGGATVLQTQEFRDILNCLAAMDDPSDQPSTVGALKSIFFGCSDRDLFHWAKSGGSFSCTAAFPEDNKVPEESAVMDALTVLRNYHALRDEIQPAVLIEQFFRERQTRELMYLEPDPAPGLRRLDLAVELARRFTEEGALSLRDTLRKFDQFKEANQDLREEPSLEFDQGKIRLMTMHSSKGLEFPIVLLADLCRSSSRDSSNFLTDWTETDEAQRQTGIRLGGNQNDGFFQTGNFDELQKKNASADSLEKTRLLYVAATRARDYLFVSLNRQERDRKSFAAQIDHHVGGENLTLWSPVPTEWQPTPFDPDATTDSPEATLIVEDRDVWMREHRQTLAVASERRWISPSSIKGPTDLDDEQMNGEKPDDVPVMVSDDFTVRGRAATEIGSAVHAAIQRALEIPNADVELIARSEAEKHGVAEDAAEVARLTHATLELPLLQEVASLDPENVWIETPVAVPFRNANHGPKIIEGRVDLIYRRDDGTLCVADFKTDRTLNRSISQMARPYIPQLGAYAYAVQKVTGIPVTEASILFSRIAAELPGEGQYRLPEVESAIESALLLASSNEKEKAPE